MRLDAQRRSAHRNLGHKWITNFSKYLCRSRPEKRLLSKLRWGQRPGSEACGKFKTSVWPTLKDALLYAGDNGADPAAATIKSEGLLNLMRFSKKRSVTLSMQQASVNRFDRSAGTPHTVLTSLSFSQQERAQA